ncbi:MAG TPA: uroporphyrinogen decarboxylase family protein [Anaerolineales bacterium]|nr:uroporphyrinogen decarboxylase family protein [Anaerolineales bacterium]
MRAKAYMLSDDKLPWLVDRIRQIVEQASAPAWGDLWDKTAPGTQNISMFAYPNPLAGIGLAPFVFSPDANFYARLFGYSLKEVFTDATTYICFTLEQMVWNYENLHHDGSASKTILINQLGFFAPSLFGMMPTYADDAVPWIKGPVISDKASFARLKQPDFYTSGLSPLVHKMYAEASDLLPKDFQVEFTTWLTGPFSLLFHLRSPVDLAMDLMDDPPFVHDMMAFATHCMKEWWKERARFLGRVGIEPLIMGDDEVGVPMISPAQYEQFVLPYESELSEAFGGIDYWHSCSNVTKLLPLIARIPKLRMMDIGPWTALEPAVRLFGKRPGSSIMKRLHPVSEVLMASEEQMRSRLLEIKATCYDIPYMLFFDGLNVLDTVEESVQQVLLLDRVCHEIFHCDVSRPDVAPEPSPLKQ